MIDRAIYKNVWANLYILCNTIGMQDEHSYSKSCRGNASEILEVRIYIEVGIFKTHVYRLMNLEQR